MKVLPLVVLLNELIEVQILEVFIGGVDLLVLGRIVLGLDFHDGCCSFRGLLLLLC
jgi:hypothetical protein